MHTYWRRHHCLCMQKCLFSRSNQLQSLTCAPYVHPSAWAAYLTPSRAVSGCLCDHQRLAAVSHTVGSWVELGVLNVVNAAVHAHAHAQAPAWQHKHRHEIPLRAHDTVKDASSCGSSVLILAVHVACQCMCVCLYNICVCVRFLAKCVYR